MMAWLATNYPANSAAQLISLSLPTVIITQAERHHAVKVYCMVRVEPVKYGTVVGSFPSYHYHRLYCQLLTAVQPIGEEGMDKYFNHCIAGWLLSPATAWRLPITTAWRSPAQEAFRSPRMAITISHISPPGQEQMVTPAYPFPAPTSSNDQDSCHQEGFPNTVQLFRF